MKIINTYIFFLACLPLASALAATSPPHPGGVTDFGTNNTNIDYAGNGNNVSILNPQGQTVIGYGDHGFLDARNQSGVRQTLPGSTSAICDPSTLSYRSPVTDDTGFSAVDGVGHETVATYVTCFYGWHGAESSPTGLSRTAWVDSMTMTDIYGSSLPGAAVGGFTLDYTNSTCTDFSLDGFYIEAGHVPSTIAPLPIEQSMRVAVWSDSTLLGYFGASDTTAITGDLREQTVPLSGGGTLTTTYEMQDMYVDFGNILQNADVSGTTIRIDYLALTAEKVDTASGSPTGLPYAYFLDDPALIGAGCASCIPEPSAAMLAILASSVSVFVRRRRS